MYHHLGKTQRRLKKIKKAIEQFDHVLEIEPDCFPAYGQIMKCARRDAAYKSKCNESAKRIIEAIKEENEKLPLRTALALISDLRSCNLDEVYPDKKELCKLFKTLILKVSYDGMYQFYEAFVAFVNFFSYPKELSEECLDLYNQIPMLKYISVESINRENYANVLDAFSVIYSLLDEEDKRKEKIRTFIKQVIKKLESSTKPYEVRSALKALNKCGCYREAASFNINEGVKSDAWILFWLAKAKIELNEPSCLDSIERALACKSSSDKYDATFYQCKALCLKVNGKNDEAKEWYRKAIDACGNDAFKKSLQKELDELG